MKLSGKALTIVLAIFVGVEGALGALAQGDDPVIPGGVAMVVGMILTAIAGALQKKEPAKLEPPKA